MQELFKKLALDLDREGKAIPIVETAFSRVGARSTACRPACLSHWMASSNSARPWMNHAYKEYLAKLQPADNLENSAGSARPAGSPNK